MLGYAGEGFLLGLSLGVTCLGTCLPVLLPYLFVEKRKFHKNITGVLWFLAGRLIGYISFGVIAGALGGRVPESYREPITGSAYIVLAILMIFTAFRRRNLEPNCPAKKHQRLLTHPLIFGLILGFNPCPAFLIAAGRAFESGGALSGAIFFTGFFGGTSVFFLPFSIFGELARMKFFRIVAKILAVAVAVWFIWIGANSIIHSIKSANRLEYSVVDPLKLDTIYVSGDSSASAYFESLVDKSVDAELLYKVVDSIPNGAFVVHLGEMPDTSSLLARNIGIFHSAPDSNSVRSSAEIIKTYGFKSESGKGFYFKLK